MTALTNRTVTLVERPRGRPKLSDFAVVDVAVGSLATGEVRVEVDTLSIDAFIRTVLDEKAFHGSVPLGGTVSALGVGRVLESQSDELPIGTAVFGPLGAQTLWTGPSAALRRLDVHQFRATEYLGALGMTTGVTAYVGMTTVGEVQDGDLVVVSAAGGAVGSLAGQIARLRGAKTVIGIAGGRSKCDVLMTSLGFDAAIDYQCEDVDARLRALAPEGVDVFFDNVGGSILDAVLLHLRLGSRVVVCGAISNYDDMDNVHGPTNYLKLAERGASMRGFAVTQHLSRLGEAEQAIGGWLRAGRLTMLETRMAGIDSFPEAVLTLLRGGHIGKLLVDVSV